MVGGKIMLSLIANHQELNPLLQVAASFGAKAKKLEKPKKIQEFPEMPLGAGTLIGRPTSRTGARTGISRLLQCCRHHSLHQ